MEEEEFEEGEMSVPTHILDEYVQFEDASITPEKLKETPDVEANN